MGGFFGAASKSDCMIDVFFGVDYHSHLEPAAADWPLSTMKSVCRERFTILRIHHSVQNLKIYSTRCRGVQPSAV